ncbi:MAG: hypothetical protein EA344_12150 [Alkalicoccus sp.]|nr:MAG: hypothetical protein EA344_12150 [Alkalicoccus sp.]
MDLRLGLHHPGVAPAAAAGKLEKLPSMKNPFFKAVFFDKEVAFPTELPVQAQCSQTTEQAKQLKTSPKLPPREGVYALIGMNIPV